MVAQWVEWSSPIPKVCCSNPFIIKHFSTNGNFEKTKMKEKEAVPKLLEAHNVTIFKMVMSSLKHWMGRTFFFSWFPAEILFWTIHFKVLLFCFDRPEAKFNEYNFKRSWFSGELFISLPRASQQPDTKPVQVVVAVSFFFSSLAAQQHFETKVQVRR